MAGEAGREDHLLPGALTAALLHLYNSQLSLLPAVAPTRLRLMRLFLMLRCWCEQETEPMGTAGPLALARQLLDDGSDQPFFVLNR